MEPQEKNVKSKQSVLEIVAGLFILILAISGIGFGSWYYLSNQPEEYFVSRRIFKKPTTKSTTISQATPTDKYKFTDKESLIALTVRQYNNPNFIPSVGVTKIEEEWALTSPIPLTFNQNTGYTVPGMGGTSYLWHKVNGAWEYVGKATEGGWDDAVKAKFNIIPKSIIPDADRTSL